VSPGRHLFVSQGHRACFRATVIPRDRPRLIGTQATLKILQFARF
jgi:hypothetical protein